MRTGSRKTLKRKSSPVAENVETKKRRSTRNATQRKRFDSSIETVRPLNQAETNRRTTTTTTTTKRRSFVRLELETDFEDESEEDFTDNDDEDFVLPMQDDDNDNDDNDNDDSDIEQISQPNEATPNLSCRNSGKATKDEIRKFSAKVDKSASSRQRSKGHNSKAASRLKNESGEMMSSEHDHLQVGKFPKRKAKKRTKSTRSTCDDCDDFARVAKKINLNHNDEKSFTRPQITSEQLAELQLANHSGYLRFEMTLLTLARQMDAEVGRIHKDQSTETDVEEKPKQKVVGTKSSDTETLRKELILSMLKEHEEQQHMESNESSDDDDDDKVQDDKVQDDDDRKRQRSARIRNVEARKTEKLIVDGNKRKAENRHTSQLVEKNVNVDSSRSKSGAFPRQKAALKCVEDDLSDSDENNWQVVENASAKRPDHVTVILKPEDFHSNGKCLSIEKRMTFLINRRRRDYSLNCHRVHLLSLVAHQQRLNSIIADEYVKAFTMSRLPSSVASAARRQKDKRIVQQLLRFYKSTFALTRVEGSGGVFTPKTLKINLLKLMRNRKTSCDVVHMFGLIAVLRLSGIRCRLCLSYRLMTHKTPQLRVKGEEIFEINSKLKHPDKATGVSDFFIEVYLSELKIWRPIDVENFSIIEDPNELSPKLEHPLVHLVGVDGDSRMTDLSPKYNANWLNKVRTLRGDGRFFAEVLARHASDDQEQLEEEQKDVAKKHAEQGLPKLISEYKNHPKYALRRHLLKFEAFHPRDPPVLGFVRNEPVFPRDAVKLLRSRDQWYRRARSVKVGETAYNVVTARPKWDRRNELFIKDLPLEIFGEWQTERFVPPVVKDGVIPRNAFGNVDLFHPDMLPIGTVHVKLPGLQRVARDLGVDCVPVVIGFDGVGRGFHAVIEGFVVCVENKDMLEKAWYERQQEDRSQRTKRIRTRIVKNWKKLIKNVIWDLRLKRKFRKNLEQEKTTTTITNSK